MVLTRKDMDKFKCADPDCKDPSHELFMHSKCHVNIPMRIIITDDILELQCAGCGKLVFHVAISIGHGDNAKLANVKCQEKDCKKKHYFIIPKCHEAPIWALYVKKTGTLEIICAVCEKPVYSFSVKNELGFNK